MFIRNKHFLTSIGISANYAVIPGGCCCSCTCSCSFSL
ncbi:TOMM family putative cytolysin BorA [Borreliella valaisiana]